MRHQQIKLITLISILATVSLTFPANFSAPLTVSQVLAQTPDATKAEANQLLQLIGTEKPKIEILKGILFDAKRIEGTFQYSMWKFNPDGSFTFTPQLGTSISGTYRKNGDKLEFQGEELASGDNSVSVDGTIYINRDNILLDAIYTDSGSLGYPQRIVIISQSLIKGNKIPNQLTPNPETSVGTQTSEINDKFKTELEQTNPNPPDSSKEIRLFNISIEGKTDAGSFDPIPGTLFITESKDSQNPISINLVSDSNLYGTNGWIMLNSEDINGKPVANTQIEVTQDRIHLEFNLSKVTIALTYTLSQDKPGSVFVQNGTLNLSISGDRISGDIRLSGLYDSGGFGEALDKPSTYEAKITGEIPKSIPVEKLKSLLNTGSFNGQWDASESGFGKIELQQNGQEVRGIYTGRGGGTIQGTVRGNRLNFTWQDHQSGKGWGFFRAVSGGGTLAGIWGKNSSPNNSQSLTATWQIPPFLNPETFTEFDITELKYLANDLAIGDRCGQAVPLLDQVMAFYQKKQQHQSPEENPAVIDIGLAQQYIVGCNFQLGNYDNLLKNLQFNLESQRILGPDESASRLFRQRTAKITKELKHKIDLFSYMENGYRNWQEGVKEDRGMLGISLEENKETQNLVIETIDKGTPAEIAGMLPGDIVVSVDDNIIKGMTLEQAYQRLRGKPGTSVNITIRRGDRELAFQLIRARFGVTSPQRQAELVEGLGFLADYHKSLVERLSTHLNKLTTLAEEIADGKADPVQALLSISEDLGSENLQLQQETNTIIERGRELFKDRREIIQESDFIFSAFQAITRNRNELNNINLQDVSAREERFARLIETNSQLSMAEKALLKGYYQNVMVLIPLSFFLEEERNFIQKLDIKHQFEENRKRSEQMVSYLANWLEQWRTQLVNDLDKIDALDKGQPFFQNVMEFLIAQGNEKEALVTSEKSRARAFADLLTTRLSSSSETRTSAETPTIEQIQQIAKQENATLVEYAIISDRNLAIWVIQPTGEVAFRQVDIKSLNISLDQLVFDTRDSIGVRNSLPIVAVVPTQRRLQRQEAMLNQQLQQLHQILIQPIADLLPTNPEDRIIFMPQGELFLVPFAALKDTDGKYLIEKHTILTSPSIQVLQLTRTQKEKMANRERGETETALVIGNPTMPSVTREFGKPPEQLPSLPGAELEAKAIAPLLNTQPLIGNQATETAVIQKMPQARIIHFATHGLLDDIRGLGSAIALAPDLSSPSAPGGKDTGNGLLTAEEILDLKLNAELVILSACNTGRGKITGDGVLGLSRSFISAGVPSIIVSLWSVPDAPTGSLMTEFYQNMQNNPDKAQALRQAILTTKAKYPNPKDWAAFTLIGEAK